jgi:hypothetical protein
VGRTKIVAANARQKDVLRVTQKDVLGITQSGSSFGNRIRLKAALDEGQSTPAKPQGRTTRHQQPLFCRRLSASVPKVRGLSMRNRPVFGRIYRRAAVWKPSPSRLSTIVDFHSKFQHFSHFVDRANWPLLARYGRFLCATGTIVGTAVERGTGTTYPHDINRDS